MSSQDMLGEYSERAAELPERDDFFACILRNSTENLGEFDRSFLRLGDRTGLRETVRNRRTGGVVSSCEIATSAPTHQALAGVGMTQFIPRLAHEAAAVISHDMRKNS